MGNLTNVFKALKIANKRIDHIEKYNLDLANESHNKSMIIKKQQEQIESLNAQIASPMQPIVNYRFKENKIVSYCLDNETNMNELAMIDFTQEDREQFAQLIGYSVSGYGELDYVSDESYSKAANIAFDSQPKEI